MFTKLRKWLLHIEAPETPHPKTNHIKETDTELHLIDLPKSSSSSPEMMSYPQPVNEIPARNFDFLTKHYAPLLWNVIDSVPLSPQETESFLLPIFSRLYAWIHLLPASEAHHHAGIGGLLVHSLEGAACAARLAKSVDFPRPFGSREHYLAKPKWQFAAAIMLLTHDLGKIFDLEVRNNDNQIWNPTQSPLTHWLSLHNVKTYYVKWNDKREHKYHELSSIALAHRYIVPEQTFQFLGRETGNLLFRALEEAIVSGEGPLAPILKQAEEESIKHDLQLQRRLGGGMFTVSLPAVRPTLNAMIELMKRGIWTVNQETSTVFTTPQGIAIHLAANNIKAIREMACHLGTNHVPSTLNGLLRVFQEAGIIVQHQNATNSELPQSENLVFLWTLRAPSLKTPLSPCVLFTDAFHLFPHTPVPLSLDQAKLIPLKQSTPTHKGVLPPNTAFTKQQSIPETNYTEQKTKKLSRNQILTEAELQERLHTPLSPEEIRDFSERTIETLIQHMQEGGSLAVGLERTDSTTLRCLSDPVWYVLRNHQINETSFKTLLRLRRKKPMLQLIESDYRFELIVTTEV